MHCFHLINQESSDILTLDKVDIYINKCPFLDYDILVSHEKLYAIIFDDGGIH